MIILEILRPDFSAKARRNTSPGKEAAVSRQKESVKLRKCKLTDEVLRGFILKNMKCLVLSADVVNHF